MISRRCLLAAVFGTGAAMAAKPVLAQQADAPTAGPGWSGVEIEVVGRTASVVALDPLGPSARAGLRSGDQITAWSGGALTRLPAGLAGDPGERIEITVVRDGAERTVCLILENAPQVVRP